MVITAFRKYLSLICSKGIIGIVQVSQATQDDRESSVSFFLLCPRR